MAHDIEAIIEHLIATRQPYPSITKFSSSPGIYAVFCALDRLPFINEVFRPDEIVYIGKTESSQLSRDAKTHFADGCTGSSTLRRTLGSLLRESLGLRPVPRNATDTTRGKRSSFKFDDDSEPKLTNWMKTNLALSFYEFNVGKTELEALEMQLIQLVIPKLNIKKNRANPYYNLLRSKRTETAQLAHKAPPSLLASPPSSTTTKKTAMPRSGLYTRIWKRTCAQIEKAIQKEVENITIQLDACEFEAAGQRQLYSFNLEFLAGRTTTKLKSSAVARDLRDVLKSSQTIMRRIGIGHWKFRLDRDFCLHVTKLK